METKETQYPSYVIKSPNDFLAIPDSYIDKALAEFCDGVLRARALKAQLKQCYKSLNIPEAKFDFQWDTVVLIDDGKYDVCPADIKIMAEVKDELGV